jgi:hypothetical protein
MCMGGERSMESASTAQAQRITAAKCNYYDTKAASFIHWHLVPADEAYSVAERSPSRLPEMIDGNLRWLECYLQSVRGRPCVRSSRSACATGTAASWLRSRPASVLQLPKSRFDFVSFKTKQPGESPFLRSQVQTVMQRRPVGPAAAYPLRETRSKADSSLLFVPVSPSRSASAASSFGYDASRTLASSRSRHHDYAQRSTTESSTHTDVVTVVVLRSRDAMFLRLASLA